MNKPNASSSSLLSRLVRAAGLLSRLKIGQRLYLGFGLVLVLLAFVGAVAFNGLTTSGRAFEESERLTANTLNVLTIERNVVALERESAKYAASGDVTALARARELATQIRDALKEADTANGTEEQRPIIRKMIELEAAFSAGLDRVSALRVSRDQTLREDLEAPAPQIQKMLSQGVQQAMSENDFEGAAIASNALEQFLLARTNVLQFIATPEIEIANTVTEQFAAFARNALLARESIRSVESKKMLSQVAGQVKDFAASFARVAEATMEMTAVLSGPMAKAASEFGAAAAEIKASQLRATATLQAASRESIATTQTVSIVLVVAAFLLGGFLAWIIARGIVRPVIGMTEAMGRLATGDMSVDVPARSRSDELGAMAASVEVFKQNMIEAERLRSEQAESQKRAAAEQKAMMARLADDFERAVGGIVRTVSAAASQMQSAAQSMTSTALETTRQTGNAAAASQQASANVQTVASAGEELASSIAEIGRQVSQSARIAGQAVEEASRTDAKIQGLADAAQKIGEVVQLINEVASQTNLLALNATIEAARAGEAGKGFAVVASEVKALAGQTAKATDEIAAQIAAIQSATRESVEAIKGIGETIGQINEIATSIASAVEEQGAATQEIARNVQEAARGTSDVSSNISEVTESAKQTGAAAEQVLGAAGDLAKQAESLRTQVDQFLAAVRAA